MGSLGCLPAAFTLAWLLKLSFFQWIPQGCFSLRRDFSRPSLSWEPGEGLLRFRAKQTPCSRKYNKRWKLTYGVTLSHCLQKSLPKCTKALVNARRLAPCDANSQVSATAEEEDGATRWHGSHEKNGKKNYRKFNWNDGDGEHTGQLEHFKELTQQLCVHGRVLGTAITLFLYVIITVNSLLSRWSCFHCSYSHLPFIDPLTPTFSPPLG